MTCKYCSEDYAVLEDTTTDGDGVCLEMDCDERGWRVVATGFFDGGYVCGMAAKAIGYCPMCGRRLEDDE